jgi:hypothetical protein
MACAICEADNEFKDKVWYTYADRLRVRDAARSAQKLISEDLTAEQVKEHLLYHHFIQPTPPGKNLNRSLALQEALTSFPRYWFYLLLALYRAQALSEQQIYQLFYLESAPDSVELYDQMQQDLNRLSYRSFLYKLWPDCMADTMRFEDSGPYYFINRQAIPLVERLMGLESESLPFGAYVTSAQQVQEAYLERDSRFLDTVVAMRSQLYRREFEFDNRPSTVHVAIEHWYAPIQLHTELSDGEAFSPAALLGFRVDSRDGALSHLLPSWWEYDRGTEEPGEVVKEILRYALYYGGERYQQQFPALANNNCPGPLIVVCEDSYRRQEITALLAAKLGDSQVPLYLVDRGTLLRDPYAEEILVKASDPSSRYSLLPVIWQEGKILRDVHAIPGTGSLGDGSGTAPLSLDESEGAEAVDLSGWAS